MPLPVSAWLPLSEAVRFLVEATGESEDRVRAGVTEAGLTGAITATGCLHSSTDPNPARYFAHPVLHEREPVPPEAWGSKIFWPESRISRYDLVRLNRADIERWLAAAATDGDEQPREGNPSPRAKKGKKETKVDAIAAWLREHYPDHPVMSVDELIRAVQKDAPQFGEIRKRTFEAALAKAYF